VAITFSCACGKSVQVGDEFAGRAGQCPNCGRTVRIPAQNGQFTAQEPMPCPAWDDPPRAERFPEAADDITRPVTHAGNPVNENDDFFHNARPEIGRLYSAFTTLRKRDRPIESGSWVMLGIVVFSGVSGMTVFGIQQFGGVLPSLETLMGVIAIAALVGALFAGIVYWLTRFRHTCTYVGAEGIARFQCAGDRERIVRSEVFLFSDAAELRIGQTRHYYNGIYTGTDYAFAWTNERGETVYRLSGRYRSEEGNPAPADPFHFALMAENAWTMHLFRDIDRILADNELLFFGLKGGDYVELGQGLFILAQSGKTIELRADQIEKMTVGGGVISVWEVGAKEGWFVNKGIHQFMYADLGNARFFLFALERLLGIRF
jgi:hypothetical protein